MRSMLMAVSVVLLAGLSGPVWAQPPAQRGRSPDRRPPTRDQSSARDRMRAMTSRFLKAPPKIGDPLPDVTVYDADGKEFRLRSLKGHYSVLVFGCLT